MKKNKNQQFVEMQQRIAKNKKVYNDLYYLTKRQQQANGYKYSETAVQYHELNQLKKY